MAPSAASPPLRVGVVGTGIAGLSCAFVLKSSKTNPDPSRFHVSILERLDGLGMDAHSIDIDPTTGKHALDSETKIRLNTPPRSLSKGYYNNLVELYKLGEIELEPWSWAFSSAVAGEQRALFRLGSRKILGARLPSMSLWAWLSPATFYTLRDGFRLYRSLVTDMHDDSLMDVTFGEYIKLKGLSKSYVDNALLPMISMICTCSYDACLEYPAQVILHYFATNSSHGQYRTKHGTVDAVQRLAAEADRVVLSCTVTDVWRGDEATGKPSRVRYSIKGSDGSVEEKTEEFDVLILACQANDLIRINRSLTAEEKTLLEAFQHEASEVVVHTDNTVMPGLREDWSPMSIILSEERDATMFSIWANDTYPEIKVDLFETWNPIMPLDPSKVLKRIQFERPLVTTESLDAVRLLQPFNGLGGIWFCGAWNAHRIPLQESGVLSALNVCAALLGERPMGDWRMSNSRLEILEDIRRATSGVSNGAIRTENDGDDEQLTGFVSLSLLRVSLMAAAAVSLSVGLAMTFQSGRIGNQYRALVK